MRVHGKCLVILLAAVLLGALPSGARAQLGGSLALLGASVTAADTDGTGLYDVLRVNASVSVGTEGFFEIAAQLQLPSCTMAGMGFETYNGTDVTLARGLRSVIVELPANQIEACAADGPFNVLVWALGFDLTGVPRLMGYTGVESPAWQAAQFDDPALRILEPITDRGEVQTDGRADALVVHVPFQVLRRAVVAGYGLAGPGPGLGGPVSAARFEPAHAYAPGTYALDFVFDGTPFYASRLNGPYNVSLAFVDPVRGIVNWTSHTTQPYWYTDFARHNADFEGPPTLVPLDPDGSGKAEFLDVHIPLRVRESGNFTVDVYVNCGMCNPPPLPTRLVHLDAGDRVVDYLISGVALSRVYNDGTGIGIGVYLDSLDGIPFGLLDRNWTTVPFPAFDPAAFQSAMPEMLYLNLTGVSGLSCPVVYASDPSTKFIGTVAGPFVTPPIPFLLYNGTFELLVGSCDPSTGSTVVPVTVSGPTYATVPVPRGVASRVDTNLSLVTWNAATLDLYESNPATASLNRWMADASGNLDGTADVDELTLLTATRFRLDFDRFLHPTALEASPLQVDGVPFQRVWAQWLPANGAGLVTAQGTVRLGVRLGLEGIAPTNGTPRHTVAVDVPFRDGWTDPHVRVALPAAAEGNLTTSTHIPTGFRGFDLSTTAVVTTLGMGAWSVHVGPPPLTGLAAVTRVTVLATQSSALDLPLIVLVLGVTAIAAIPVVLVLLVLLVRSRRRGHGERSPPP